jgi:hypothetical protein
MIKLTIGQVLDAFEALSFAAGLKLEDAFAGYQFGKRVYVLKQDAEAARASINALVQKHGGKPSQQDRGATSFADGESMREFERDLNDFRARETEVNLSPMKWPDLSKQSVPGVYLFALTPLMDGEMPEPRQDEKKQVA